MAFIKVGDTVINTEHIVAVELDRISIGGKCCVVISVAAKSGLFKRKSREFWFDGEAAAKLRDYFEHPDHVIELLPSSSPRSQARERIRQRQRIRYQRSLAPPEDIGEKADNWDNAGSDPPDDPPPPPTIRRRPWKPQPPDPLSATASVEPFNPPIP